MSHAFVQENCHIDEMMQEIESLLMELMDDIAKEEEIRLLVNCFEYKQKEPEFIKRFIPPYGSEPSNVPIGLGVQHAKQPKLFYVVVTNVWINMTAPKMWKKSSPL